MLGSSVFDEGKSVRKMVAHGPNAIESRKRGELFKTIVDVSA
jgi:hypothetical protein